MYFPNNDDDTTGIKKKRIKSSEKFLQNKD